MRAFVLTPTYRIVGERPEVHLHAIAENGEPCLLIDDRVRPHFFVRERERRRVEEILGAASVEPVDLRTFAGESVLRIDAARPADVPPLRRRLEQAGIECLEADVRFAYRYMIDHGIRGSLVIDGEATRHDDHGWVFLNPTLHSSVWHPNLRTLSIDIETSPDASSLYSIALCAGDFRRVLLLGDRHVDGAEPVHSERGLIQRFLDYLQALDPDVITGWNVVDFDLAVLSRIARQHGIRFVIGRTADELDIRSDPSFTRESRAVVYGRLVLDALSLMRGAFIRLRDYKLETAARTFVGEGKLISGDHRGAEIERLYRQDPQRFVAYNLQDARLVLEILDATGLIDLAVQRSLLTGMPPDRVSAAIASVDSLYLGALRGRGFVAPSVRNDASDTYLLGGYVRDSVPGLYRSVLVFDFRSLYPSIIRTFNIDPLTLTDRDRSDEADLIEAPNGACFRRDVPGILPELVASLAAERATARSAGQNVKANAVKILMNSLYGVLGSPASRLFSPDVANAITHFGQLLIRTAAHLVEKTGRRVIYGDTDSLFVEAATTTDAEARVLAEELRVEIGTGVADFVRERYRCESHLDLEFEKLYSRFFMPEVRGGTQGSKKRYAGLVVEDDGSERIDFVGLESVRRDWTDAAKHFQLGLLERVFHDRPVQGFVRDFLQRLRGGEMDADLIYRKAVRKGLDQYTRNTPPHVRAARKLGTPARFVEYVITTAGPEPIGHETAPLDYDHYVEHQIAPVAEAVLHLLGTDFATVADLRRQLSLF